MVMVAASNAQGSSEGEDETFFVSNVTENLTLTGNGGKDTFDFSALSTGTVTIADFNTNGVDTLDLSDVLVGYNDYDKLNKFIRVTDSGDNGDVTLTIDKDGNESGTDLTITLTNLADIGNNNDWDLEQFYAHGFIVL
jgi:hypothetical protein